MLFSLVILFLIMGAAFSSTGITVKSQYKKEINIKIQGAGVGGCDIIVNNGDENNSDCWCLWGTLNYSFCAYSKSPIELLNTTIPQSGRCPKITGASLVCDDLSSLGNCYGKGYTCNVDSTGLCHCSGV